MTTGDTVDLFAYNGLGDRVQQTAAGVPITYTLDLNAGLTQVLSDGTHTYLYGLDRIAEVNAATEYFLGDALGSVRQLVDEDGEITFSQAYQPYGEALASEGDSASAYGFTGEMSDPSGLLYLRARYYDPAQGRFISRDSWGGDAYQPMSYNAWMYVYSNPVNYTDLSGHFFPIWCQSMPSKATYEACVDFYYGIEPLSYLDMGKYVTGSKGCYHGPTEYRAPGYLEGIEWWFFPMRIGKEIVYDFARMERARFEFVGAGINDSADMGAGVALYGGYIMGLRSDKHLVDHYLGESRAGQIGASADIGIGIGGGVGGFYSVDDHMLRGVTWYVGSSVSADILEIADINADVTLQYSPIRETEKPYLLENNHVNLGELLPDIMSGDNTVWGLYVPLPNSTKLHLKMNSEVINASRAYGAFLAMRAVTAYEDIKNADSK